MFKLNHGRNYFRAEMLTLENISSLVLSLLWVVWLLVLWERFRSFGELFVGVLVLVDLFVCAGSSC